MMVLWHLQSMEGDMQDLFGLDDSQGRCSIELSIQYIHELLLNRTAP